MHRSRITALAVLATLAATACAATPEAKPSAQPAEATAPCSPEGAALRITALHYETGEIPTFDTDCLAAPAGEAFTIELKNDDVLEHNVSIYPKEGASFSEALFHGELFRGPGETKTYEVPALEAGTYAFRCDEHLSNMKGIFVVA